MKNLSIISKRHFSSWQFANRLKNVIKSFLTVYLILLFANATAQTFPSPSSCTSKDLLLVGATLPGTDVCNSCAPGSSITRTLFLSINNKTGSTRTSFAFWGTLRITNADGSLASSTSISGCVGPVPRNSITTLASQNLTYTCGQSLELRDLYLAWTDASPGSTCASLLGSPSTINPKCGTQPVQQIIAGVEGNFTVSDATCTAPGSVTVSPFGGKSPYTVTLIGSPNIVRTGITTSTTFSNLSAGTYNFTITDANNCTVSRSRSVATTGTLPAPAATVVQPTCTVATGTVNVTSPTSGLTYTLVQNSTTVYTAVSGVFSNVATGTYVLKVANSICSTNGNNVIVNSQPATPAAPGVSVVNNCDGSSDLTATGYSGALNWSNGSTAASIHVTNASATTYTVTQTNADGCTSASGSGTTAPKSTPPAPGVSVVNNCDGSSDLTATSYSGALTWSNGSTAASIHVTDANPTTYTVTQTNADGCTSANGSGTTAPKSTPAAPGVSVVNNCDGSSDLTATGYSGSFTWSNGSNAVSIHVTDASPTTYTVTHTNADGCISATGSGTTAPKTTPTAPGVSVVNNCDGSSDLMATGYTGALTWSNGSTAASIHVTDASPTTYTVTQTNTDGCTSAPGSGTTAPKSNPATPVVCVVQPSLCGPTTGSITIISPLGSGYEYSIDNGATWQAGTSFPNLAAGSVTGILARNNGCISLAADCSASNCTTGRQSSNTSTAATTKTAIPAVTITAVPAAINIVDKTAAIETTVMAYPNPFNDKVKFVINAAETANGRLEVFNMFGQKVKTVYQGVVPAGVNNFELNLPLQKQSGLVYRLTLGEKRITGKLIQLRP